MKTAIRVMQSNLNKIEAKVDFMQSAAKVRTITGIAILSTIKEIENRLSSILHKKDWHGLSFTVDDNAQKFPSAYKYVPESTIYKLEYRKSGWYLIWVMRSRCGIKRILVCGMDTKKEQLANFITSHF